MMPRYIQFGIKQTFASKDTHMFPPFIHPILGVGPRSQIPQTDHKPTNTRRLCQGGDQTSSSAARSNMVLAMSMDKKNSLCHAHSITTDLCTLATNVIVELDIAYPSYSP